MSYEVDVLFHPFFELCSSLDAYMNKQSHKHYDLKPGWAASVKKQISPELHQQIEELYNDRKKDPFFPFAIGYGVMISHDEWMNEKDPLHAIHWLEQLNEDALYQKMNQLLGEKMQVPSISLLHHFRIRWIRVLTGWYKQYFRQMDPDILTGLGKDAEEKRKDLSNTPVEEWVEKATQGLWITQVEGLQKVILFPQYHCRPFNLFDYVDHTCYIGYPVDALPPAVESPPPQLLRITHALSDSNRLRILHYLKEESRSFTEIVQHMGLAKSTINHHLVALRAAGIVRVIVTLKKGFDRYQLRQTFIKELSDYLHDYLET